MFELPLPALQLLRSGSVNFQEFESAHALLQAQLQAAAKAKAKAGRSRRVRCSIWFSSIPLRDPYIVIDRKEGGMAPRPRRFRRCEKEGVINCRNFQLKQSWKLARHDSH